MIASPISEDRQRATENIKQLNNFFLSPVVRAPFHPFSVIRSLPAPAPDQIPGRLL